MIAETTKCQIKGYLEGFLQRMIDEKLDSGFDPKELRPSRRTSQTGNLKPFHESLLPDGLLSITEFERSFSTKLGTTFEEVARLIAHDYHSQAERSHRVAGLISLKVIKRIEEIMSEVGSSTMPVDYPKLVKEIVGLAGDGEQVERTSIADLCIKKTNGVDMYFEIKSPKPNKGQCLEATGRLLQIHAITHRRYPKVNAYFAMAYNPWGIEKSTYNHSFSINYMDLNHEVLIGKEFWELVGGMGTYDEVLEIYQTVGKEKGPHLLNQLALGY